MPPAAMAGTPGYAAALIETYIDRDLLALGEVWAAAGTPHAVFRLAPDELLAMTGGRVVAVA